MKSYLTAVFILIGLLGSGLGRADDSSQKPSGGKTGNPKPGELFKYNFNGLNSLPPPADDEEDPSSDGNQKKRHAHDHNPKNQKEQVIIIQKEVIREVPRYQRSEQRGSQKA